MKNLLKEIREFALASDVPIMQEDTLKFIVKILDEHQYQSVLELGTAIGYSSLYLATHLKQLQITTIERDEERYLLAQENINSSDYRPQIKSLWMDIFDYRPSDLFDVLIIDAAKAQNQSFFDLFKNNVRKGGCIIIDNMDFHGIDAKKAKADHRRNLSQMVEKIERFDQYIHENDYKYDRYNLGDGVLVVWM